MPLDRFCHERIFRPLGLRASAFVDLTAVRTRRLTPVTDLIAPTERCPWRQRILCGEVHDDNAYAMGGVAGHAGLFANAAEVDALAGLLRAAGHSVTGSDEHVYPPASTLLEELGIPVFHGYDPARVAGVDLVVCGNAVRRTNPEAEAAEAGGFRMLSMPAAVEEMFLAGRSPLVVAGTHGKTTSSAMLAWVLERTGRDPGFLVGGVPRELERSFALGRGPWFVIEGDEYDSAYFDKEAKFLHYRPAMLLLNAIEFDHADIYRDLEHVKSAFRKLLGILPAGAPLIACGDFPHVLDVIRGTHARVRRFGLGEANEWRVTDLTDDGATRFTVRQGGRAVCRLVLQPPGAINARNALGVLLVAREVGIGWEDAAAALAEFRGVRRRQERSEEHTSELQSP